MNPYKNYIDILRNILQNFAGEFDYIIKKILIKIFKELMKETIVFLKASRFYLF